MTSQIIELAKKSVTPYGNSFETAFATSKTRQRQNGAKLGNFQKINALSDHLTTLPTRVTYQQPTKLNRPQQNRVI